MSSLGAVLPFVLILAVFWLLILRPQQRRQRELRALQSSLSAGSEVMLTSGIYGTVSATADDHVLVEIAPGVTIKIARGAVAQVMTNIEPAADEPVDSEEN
ncbi:preprotein translocase subunit YajC [Nocardioides terrae]|uniref:Preprotein translocase subunit YajC n=1 Tax=Nocardioides terrae TaxID=574651 RepID=A0A1I1LX32_9ACTN|nr:preprotein translocase subunit YajC [Nocardioides terrae]SFC77545.1 preprotein translocase subunit YajC [Nocardioides terrae]